MTMMINQSHVGTPPDFCCRTGATGFERGFGDRAAVVDGADGPSTRGIVVTGFVGSAGGFGGVGTVTGASRASDGAEGAAWAPASEAAAAGVTGEEPATAAGADRGALAIGAAVEGSTAGATFATEAAGVCAPTLGGGWATSA